MCSLLDALLQVTCVVPFLLSALVTGYPASHGSLAKNTPGHQKTCEKTPQNTFLDLSNEPACKGFSSSGPDCMYTHVWPYLASKTVLKLSPINIFEPPPPLPPLVLSPSNRPTMPNILKKYPLTDLVIPPSSPTEPRPFVPTAPYLVFEI